MNAEQKDRFQEARLMTQTTSWKLQGQLESLSLKYKTALRSVGVTAGTNCDWHDNFAYDQACRDAQVYSRQVEELKRKLSAVEFIKPRLETEKVGIGNTVIVQFLGEKSPEKYTILGPDDFGTEQGWISFQSPVGQAMIGKKIGENILMDMGDKGKTQVIRILEILPGEFE